MEVMPLHRGRLIDHIHLVVRDPAASKRFYRAMLGALKLPLGGEATTTSGPTNSSSSLAPRANRPRAV